MNCSYCGLTHDGKICHLIKAIEYFENGMVKRVEFKTAADSSPPIHQHSSPWPHLGPQVSTKTGG